jgi:serine/threonine-protein kinase
MKPMIDNAVVDNGDELPPLPSRPMPAVPGYDQLEEIGRGGMGVVYRARHAQLGRVVALKLLRGGAAAGVQDRQRFLREARAGAALHHPNIVQVFDVGEHIGASFLAMELVSGKSLADRLATGPMLPREAAELVDCLARAVDHAHQQGVIHRDLKPANVLLQRTEDRGRRTEDGSQRTEDGERRTESRTIPKIADFGLARLLADDSSGTLSGTILGTPSYMAPEQAAGRIGEVGPSVDIYALGAILYECLTGRPPFRAASAVETLHQIETVEPVSPSRLQLATPRDLSTICMCCLQKEPKRRYATAGALADDLRNYLDGRPIKARPVGPLERTWRWCRRNPRVALLLATLALAFIGGFIGIFSQWRRAEHLYTVADTQRQEAEANLKRYQQAAEDFADLIDLIDMDQLLNIRAAPLRQELLKPALERNRQFLSQNASDPQRRGEAVRAQIRVAVLTRLLAQTTNQGYESALEEGIKALGDLEAYSGDRPNVMRYRRERAALTQSNGYLFHALRRSEEALRTTESARTMRQELLDSQPDHLDFRSELASTYNDIGLIHIVRKQNEDSLAALQRAIALQKEVVQLAPNVQRYRRFLCNHYFNCAMTQSVMGRTSDALATVNECQIILPHDPDQWVRIARIRGLSVGQPGGINQVEEVFVALRRAFELGLNPSGQLNWKEFNGIRQLPEFKAFAAEVNAKKQNQK